MSKRRDIEDQIRSLGEISAIMSAMKNLALMEIQKLTRLLSAQDRVVTSMQEAGADFLKFYPEALSPTDDGRALYVVIGSERAPITGMLDQAEPKAVGEQKQGSDLGGVLLVGGLLLAKLLVA